MRGLGGSLFRMLNVSVKINGIAKKYQRVLFSVYILYHHHCKQEFFSPEFQFTANKTKIETGKANRQGIKQKSNNSNNKKATNNKTKQNSRKKNKRKLTK